MMAHVDDVEAAPLIGAEGTEDVVGCDALQAEVVATEVEKRVHRVEVLAEKLDEFGQTRA